MNASNEFTRGWCLKEAKSHLRLIVESVGSNIYDQKWLDAGRGEADGSAILLFLMMIGLLSDDELELWSCRLRCGKMSIAWEIRGNKKLEAALDQELDQELDSK